MKSDQILAIKHGPRGILRYIINAKARLQEVTDFMSICRLLVCTLSSIFTVDSTSSTSITGSYPDTTLFRPGSKVIKRISCLAQLSMKFFLLNNVKMPTVVGILTFMSRKNCILSLSEPEKKAEFLDILTLMRF